jgi:hypothetical protein
MARKLRFMKPSDGPSRISVQLDGETHRRLRALALVRSDTIQGLVAAMIEEATRGVRLPSVGGAYGAIADSADEVR